MKQKFDVTGMSCSACSARIENTVRKRDGVKAVSVNLLTNSMLVEYDEKIISESGVMAAVTDAGYAASPAGRAAVRADAPSPTQSAEAAMKKRLILSFALLLPLMYISMGHMVSLPLPGFLSGMENAVGFAFAQFLLCLPLLVVNKAYYRNGFRALLHGAPNMDTLIAVGSSASLLYGVFAIFRMGYGLGTQDMQLVHAYYHDLYFESAVMILALINLGKYLEARSKGKTSESIARLMDLRPKTAMVERNGGVAELPVEDVQVGDVVQVKPGGSIPVDGLILSGSTGVDESMITGESIPAEKTAGDTVIAATINKTGFIRVQTQKVGEDTTLSQIIRLVEDANAGKAPIAKLADKIAGVFVPIVMGIALLTGVVWLFCGAGAEFALSCAICVLVISCPCALGLATPVALMVGTGKGAENGVLIKSGESLEITHNIQTVVLDKTGTITEGKPVVTKIVPVGMSEDSLLRLAATLEKGSEHPLSEAVITAAAARSLALSEASDFLTVPGRGVQAVVASSAIHSGAPVLCIAGNAAMMQERGVPLEGCEGVAEALSEDGNTPLFFADADDKRMLGVIAVADTVKPTSAQAISALQKEGVEVVMLTGDNEKTARAIQRRVGANRVVSGVLPADKEREIAKLQAQGKIVAMVGDGINDAPALAKADVGVAIGAGTDVAIESADVVLMKSDLMDVVTAIDLSKAVIRNVKENLFWAFFYNLCGIPLAAGVFYTAFGWRLSPMFGAAAMSLSSLFVVSNALRLRFFKPRSAERSQTAIIDVSISTQNEEEEKSMYTMKIDGMMCEHCSGRLEKALNEIVGVKAAVDLANKQARIEAS
ncbi:MAG: heavy metal translocating P-type ATPase, partial [Eubacteriales bacterium]|nr:heavy metal translocating P-type ATPase [Eubacteriales bacterium]